MTLTESRETMPLDSPPAESAPPQSLGEINAALRNYKAMLTNPGFDPAKSIGQLARIENGIELGVEARMAKVDRTVAWVRACEDYAARCMAMADQLIAEAEMANANAGASLNYVDYQLDLDGVTEFAGHEFVLRRQRKKGSKGKLIPPRHVPTVEDFVGELGSFVDVIPPVEQRYKWNKKAIKAALKADAKDAKLVGFVIEHDMEIAYRPIGKPETRKLRGKK